MANDTGERTSVIVARSDDASWPYVLAELQNGATLLRIPKLRKGYVDRIGGLGGPGISDTRILKLEREGVLRIVGANRYALMGGQM